MKKTKFTPARPEKSIFKNPAGSNIIQACNKASLKLHEACKQQ